MPRYRAHIDYTDDHGQEHTDVVEVESASENSVDLARAAQEAWQGFGQNNEERLPHNIRWERIE